MHAAAERITRLRRLVNHDPDDARLREELRDCEARCQADLRAEIAALDGLPDDAVTAGVVARARTIVGVLSRAEWQEPLSGEEVVALHAIAGRLRGLEARRREAAAAVDELRAACSAPAEPGPMGGRRLRSRIRGAIRRLEEVRDHVPADADAAVVHEAARARIRRLDRTARSWWLVAAAIGGVTAGLVGAGASRIIDQRRRAAVLAEAGERVIDVLGRVPLDAEAVAEAKRDWQRLTHDHDWLAAHPIAADYAAVLRRGRVEAARHLAAADIDHVAAANRRLADAEAALRGIPAEMPAAERDRAAVFGSRDAIRAAVAGARECLGRAAAEVDRAAALGDEAGVRGCRARIAAATATADGVERRLDAQLRGVAASRREGLERRCGELERIPDAGLVDRAAEIEPLAADVSASRHDGMLEPDEEAALVRRIDAVRIRLGKLGRLAESRRRLADAAARGLDAFLQALAAERPVLAECDERLAADVGKVESARAGFAAAVAWSAVASTWRSPITRRMDPAEVVAWRDAIAAARDMPCRPVAADDSAARLDRVNACLVDREDAEPRCLEGLAAVLEQGIMQPGVRVHEADGRRWYLRPEGGGFGHFRGADTVSSGVTTRVPFDAAAAVEAPHAAVAGQLRRLLERIGESRLGIDDGIVEMLRALRPAAGAQAAVDPQAHSILLEPVCAAARTRALFAGDERLGQLAGRLAAARKNPRWMNPDAEDGEAAAAAAAIVAATHLAPVIDGIIAAYDREVARLSRLPEFCRRLALTGWVERSPDGTVRMRHADDRVRSPDRPLFVVEPVGADAWRLVAVEPVAGRLPDAEPWTAHGWPVFRELPAAAGDPQRPPSAE